MLAAAAVFAYGQPAFSANRYGSYLASICVTCFVRGSGAGIPDIAGLPEAQFVAARTAYKSRKREGNVMQSIASRLMQDDIEALAIYFSGLGK